MGVPQEAQPTKWWVEPPPCSMAHAICPEQLAQIDEFSEIKVFVDSC